MQPIETTTTSPEGSQEETTSTSSEGSQQRQQTTSSEGSQEETTPTSSEGSQEETTSSEDKLEETTNVAGCSYTYKQVNFSTSQNSNKTTLEQVEEDD